MGDNLNFRKALEILNQYPHGETVECLSLDLFAGEFTIDEIKAILIVLINVSKDVGIVEERLNSQRRYGD